MFKKTALFFVLLGMAFAELAQAQRASSSASVKTSEVKKTKWNSFYSYSYRHFLGEESRNFFPEKLDVTLQLLGGYYSINDQLKVGVTASHVKNDIVINIPSFMGGDLQAQTSGIGDTYIGAYQTWGDEYRSGEWEFAAQVSLPTGDVEQTQSGRLVSYPGQLGSGTYDFVPFVKWKKISGSQSFQLQALGHVRTGLNKIGYRLGDDISLRGRYEYAWVKWLSTYASFSYKFWHEVRHANKVAEYNQAHQIRPTSGPHSSHGAVHPGPGGGGGARPSAVSSISSDPFADGGSRWSATIGVKSGIYLGAGNVMVLQLGKPVYADQAGSLEGLSTDWNGSAQAVFSF